METGSGWSGEILDETSRSEALAALRSHARFAEAVATAAARLVQAYEAHRVMNRVFNDRGSVVVGLLALYLHFCGGPPGLTLSRMQALCSETAVCSRGRSAAMIALMRFARYLTPATAVVDRRIRPGSHRAAHCSTPSTMGSPAGGTGTASAGRRRGLDATGSEGISRGISPASIRRIPRGVPRGTPRTRAGKVF